MFGNELIFNKLNNINNILKSNLGDAPRIQYFKTLESTITYEDLGQGKYAKLDLINISEDSVFVNAHINVQTAFSGGTNPPKFRVGLGTAVDLSELDLDIAYDQLIFSDPDLSLTGIQYSDGDLSPIDKTKTLALENNTIAAVFSMMGSWTVSNNMNVARYGLAGCGTQTSGLSFGGTNSVTTYLRITEEYDGTSWTLSNNMNVTKGYLGGCGTQTAGLSFGGQNAVSYFATTEEYDGTSWTLSNNLNVARFVVGCGTQIAGLGFGGYNGTYFATTEEYDGTSWTLSNNLNVARNAPGGCGTQTAGLSFGGSNGTHLATTEEYDGTFWTLSNNINTSKNGLGGCGTQTAGLSFGGWNGISYLATTEEYDGTSWTLSNDMNVVRRLLAGCGTQTAGLSFGGTNGTYLASTEEYDTEFLSDLTQGALTFNLTYIEY
jgi:hypothetical protein